MATLRRIIWICGDCDFAIEGDEHDAHRVHHHEQAYWDHWIFEVDATPLQPIALTGKHIHTSDHGGFYLDDKPVYQESIEAMFTSTVAVARRNQLREQAQERS